MKTLKNYSRYLVDENGMIINRHTENVIKLEGFGDRQYYRLTGDDGKRKQIYLTEILEQLKEEPKPQKTKDESPKMKIGCFVLTQKRHQKLLNDMEKHKHADILKEVRNRNFDERGTKTEAIKELLKLGIEEPLICLVCEIGAGTVYNYRKKLQNA